MSKSDEITDLLIDLLKDYMSEQLRLKRKESGLSQERMSEKLCISTRAYIELEHANSFCSTIVLILFVINFDIDKDKLFNGFQEIIEKAQNDSAA